MALTQLRKRLRVSVCSRYLRSWYSSLPNIFRESLKGEALQRLENPLIAEDVLVLVAILVAARQVPREYWRRAAHILRHSPQWNRVLD